MKKIYSRKFFLLILLPLLGVAAYSGVSFFNNMNYITSLSSNNDVDIFATDVFVNTSAPLVAPNEAKEKGDKNKALTQNEDNKNVQEKTTGEQVVKLSKNTKRLSVDTAGRKSPFVPYKEKNLNYNSYNFGDLPLPPASGEADEILSSLVSAKVTGIVYDDESPTAIINVLDDDYLVRPGDKIESFVIEAINKDYVAIKTGQNIFRAKVGDIVEGEIYGSGIYNLGHRFAGKKTPARDEDILIVETKKNSGEKKPTSEAKGLNDLELPPIPIQVGDTKVELPRTGGLPLPISE